MPSDYNDTGIATGAIANIQNGADAVPVKSWEIEIKPNLDGKSQIIATQTGRNLFDKENPNVVDGYIDTVSFNTGNQNAKTIYIPIKGGETYTVSKTAGVRFAIATSENIPSSGALYTSRKVNNTASSLYITADVNDKYLWAWVFLDGTDTGTLADMLASIQIELGSTATTYEPYTETTVSTVSLGRTIYGGSVDVVAGTGTEGYNKITLSSLLTNLSIAQIGATGVYRIRFDISDAKAPLNSQVFSGLCDYYTPLSANQTYNKNEGISISASGQCFIYDSRFNASTSLNDFKTWIDSNPVNLCYELADEYKTDFTFTPITPTPETALGVNNFWADEGDSELTYYKDGYGYTSVTVHKETPEGEPVEETRKFHRIIYEGQVDVIRGTGLINIGESGTEYDPPEQISFTPVEIATDEGENTFYADEGVSVITYRREVE